ncbi:MAG: hypothetical protein A3J74_03665 [Elusimicrobia bacterium RIFCSPHIGHO2_02_FULL_57_9]|nr:MAG: hypothetical protein A3J74_03665 [Elusimicrobia bacterium RIFCSPHIGHO2_02_FULL_57_9]
MTELSQLWQIVPAEAEPRISAIAADPSDNRVLECAVAAKAQCIASGDKHLLDLGQFGGILILSPNKFLQHYGLK